MIRHATTIVVLLALTGPVFAQDGGAEEQFDIEEAMRRIHRMMGKAEESLLESAKRRDAAETGQETVKEIEKLLKGHQSQGKGIVEKINELLDNLPRQQGGGGGADQQPQDPKQEPKPEPETGTDDKDPENSRKGDPKDGKEDKEDPEQKLADKPPPDEEKSKAPVDLSKEWLKGLPPQLRQDVLNGNFERVPEKYRKLIEAWTKKMARIDDD